MSDFKDLLRRALDENSTQLSTIPSIIGYFNVSEWCMIITLLVTIANFVKGFVNDRKKLKLEEEKTKLLKILSENPTYKQEAVKHILNKGNDEKG